MTWLARMSLLLIFVLYFLTRFYHLTVLPIFGDEAVYLNLSKIISTTGEQFFISLVNGKPPLLTWIIAAVFRIWSAEEYLFAGRFVVALIGLFGVIGLFRLSCLFFSKRTALIATTLYVLSPFIFFYDRITLFDNLLLVSTIWVAYYSAKAALFEKWRDSIFWGIALAIAFYSKPPALFVWLISLVSFCVIVKKLNKHTVLLALFASLIGQFFNNLLRFSSGYFYYQKLTNSYSIFDKKQFDIVFNFVMNVKLSTFWMGEFLTIIVFLLSICGMAVLIKRKKKAGIVMMLYGVVPILIFCLIAEIYFPRYILFCVPFFLMPAAFLISKMPNLAGGLVLFLIVFQTLHVNFWLFAKPEVAPIPQIERKQYIYGQSSGFGLEPLLNFIEKQAKKRKIEVLVSGTLSNFPNAFLLEFAANKNVRIINDWNEKHVKHGQLVAIMSRKTNYHDDILKELNLEIIVVGNKPEGNEPFYLAKLRKNR